MNNSNLSIQRRACTHLSLTSSRRLKCLAVFIATALGIFSARSFENPPVVDCGSVGSAGVSPASIAIMPYNSSQIEPITMGYPALRSVFISITPGVKYDCDLCCNCGNESPWDFFLVNSGVPAGGGVVNTSCWLGSPGVTPTGLSPLTDLGGRYGAVFIPQQAGDIYFSAFAHATNPAGATPYNGCVGGPVVSVGAQLTVPFTVLAPMRLGYWRFNNPNWLGEEGEVPSVANNLYYVTNWNYGALKITNQQSSAQQNSVLGYPAYRPDGTPNVTVNSGSIRFWFSPAWNSSDLLPQRRLFEAQQNASTPIFLNAVSLNSGGVQGVEIRFKVYGTTVRGFVSNWTSGQWHQIVVTYSLTANTGIFGSMLVDSSVRVYVDGQQLGDPGSADISNYQEIPLTSFTLGNSANGLNPAIGLFDELETFNYVLHSSDIQANYQQVSNLDSDGDGLSNLQEIALGTNPYIADTDGDGVIDSLDAAPLDPNRWDPGDPTETTGPVITLLEPINAVLQP